MFISPDADLSSTSGASSRSHSPFLPSGGGSLDSDRSAAAVTAAPRHPPAELRNVRRMLWRQKSEPIIRVFCPVQIVLCVCQDVQSVAKIAALDSHSITIHQNTTLSLQDVQRLSTKANFSPQIHRGRAATRALLREPACPSPTRTPRRSSDLRGTRRSRPQRGGRSDRRAPWRPQREGVPATTREETTAPRARWRAAGNATGPLLRSAWLCDRTRVSSAVRKRLRQGVHTVFPFY